MAGTAKQVRTACPLDCFDACGLVATVEDGKVTRVVGDPDHPITRGFTCAKAKRLVERTYAPDRLLYPLRKTDQGWRRISWDAALDLVAERLAQAKAEYGPASIFYNWDGASAGLLKDWDMTFWQAFGGATLPRGSLCWSAGIAANKYDFGTRSAHESTDFVNSRCIILWGHNPVDTKVHVTPFILEAKRRGAEVVLIDPICTRSAGLATMVVQPRPGTDAVLAMALARRLSELGFVDETFLGQHTLGAEEYFARVSPWTLTRAEEVTGVPATDLERLARLYGANRPAAILVGYGIQRHRLGGCTVRAIDALAAMTGNIGVSGGGASYAHASWGILNSAGPDRDEVARRTVARASLGRDLLALTDPPIAAAVITRSNPACQSPDTSSVCAALTRIPFMVVMDHFLTDTAQLADVVLPVTNSLEEDDIYAASWHHHLVLGPKVIDAPGECRSELDIWQGLAVRLGLVEPARRPARELLADIIAPLTPFGITLDRLEREGAQRNPLAPAVPFEDRRFPTPSGRYEFFSSTASADGYDPLPGVASWPPAGLEVYTKQEFPLVLLSPQPRDQMHSQFANLASTPPEDRELTAYAHPHTAAEAGVGDGEEAILASPRGEITLRLRHSLDVLSGVIVAYDGVWLRDGRGINTLTPPRETDFGGQAAYYDCACALRKAR